MNWKNILIFGGIAVLGVVGYLVLRKKDNKNKSVQSDSSVSRITNRGEMTVSKATLTAKPVFLSNFTGKSIV